MKIKHFVFNPLSTNCYLVYDQQKAWIIDPCFCNEEEFSRLKQFLLSEALSVEKILCTHLHFDHIFGAQMAADAFQCEVYAHIGDSDWMSQMARYAAFFGLTCGPELKKISHLYEGDLLQSESMKARVIEVPGHSKGGLAYYFEEDKLLFAGDSLFAGSIGRTDLDGGSYEQLIESIRCKLLTLPDDCIVYCGHGPSTSIAVEKAENPYL